MTTDDLIEGVIEREGGYVNHPADRGGPTKYGITAATLGNYLGLGRVATAEEVKAMPRQTADAIYKIRYIAQPGFTKENIPFEPLRIQLIDFGINSGQERAIRWLQRVLRLAPDEITGKLDEITLHFLNSPTHRLTWPELWYQLVNDALVAARLYMIDRWTDASPDQKVFEEGVESRALHFFLAYP